MIVTEEAAKGKTCPQSLASETPCNCAGSDCMAWRWHGGGHLGYCGMAGVPVTPPGAWVSVSGQALKPLPGQA